MKIFTFTDIVIFIGFAQGLILSVILYIKAKYKSAKFLAIFIFLLSFQLLLQSTTFLNYISKYGILLSLLDTIPLLLSPLLYFYILYTFRINQLKTKLLYHIIPGILCLLIHTTIYIIVGKITFNTFIQNSFVGNPPFYLIIIQFSKVISGIFYSYAILKIIINFKNQLINNPNKSLKVWFIFITLFYLLIWLTILILAIIYNTPDFDASLLSALIVIQVLLFLLFIYTISIFSNLHPQVLEYNVIEKKDKNIFNLTENETQIILNKINYQMEENKLFLDPDLSLRNFAQILNIHENILSFIINQTGRNFSLFLNTYRVNYFIELTRIKDLSNETILSLAYRSGFNSKSSFNRIFKEIMSTTPLQFIKNQKI